MDIGGRGALIAVLLGLMLAGCSTTADDSRVIAAKPASPLTIDRGVAAFRDICFAFKAPYTGSYAAAARYGIKKFETKQRSSWIGGKYAYSEGATDDRSLIVGINPQGSCIVQDRRHPGMADDKTIEDQFAALIRTKYPLASRLRENSVAYTTVENGKSIDFAFALDYKGYNMFGSPL